MKDRLKAREEYRQSDYQVIQFILDTLRTITTLILRKKLSSARYLLDLLIAFIPGTPLRKKFDNITDEIKYKYRFIGYKLKEIAFKTVKVYSE